MTKYLAALFAALFVAFAAQAAEPPTSITLNAKPGNVTFKHATHKAQKCDRCHADAKGGKITFETKEKAHGLCVECHKAEKKGPAKCAECHKKA